MGGMTFLFSNIVEQIKRFSKSIKGKKRLILVLALIGIFLIFISDFFNKKEQPEPFGKVESEELLETNQPTVEDDEVLSNINKLETAYETSLEKMLNNIQGISEVEAMVNIDSTNVKIYEKNIMQGLQTTVETDQNGGRRTVEDETKESQLVFLRKGDEESPLLIHTKKPEVRGVFIIAKGVDNKVTEQKVVEAVSRVLDVPSYRISVLSK